MSYGSGFAFATAATVAMIVVDATALGFTDRVPTPLVLRSPRGTPLAGLALTF